MSGTTLLSNSNTKSLYQSSSQKKPQRRAPVGGFESESNEASQNEKLKGIEKTERKEIPKKIAQRKEFTVFALSQHKEKIEIKEKMEEVRRELVITIQELKKANIQISEVEKAASEQIVDPGVYHLNFFEKLITMLKVLRMNISSGGSWLDATFAKKQKQSFAGRAKAGGAGYRMSHERRTAIQTG